MSIKETRQFNQKIEDLILISEIIAKIEEEHSKTAEEIFIYLTSKDENGNLIVPDEDIINGTIKPSDNSKINKYIKYLNRLFLLSLSNKNNLNLINRNVLQALNPKLYTLLMCIENPISIEYLCNIVNEENLARFPRTRIGVKAAVRVLDAIQNSRNL